MVIGGVTPGGTVGTDVMGMLGVVVMVVVVLVLLRRRRDGQQRGEVLPPLLH